MARHFAIGQTFFGKGRDSAIPENAEDFVTTNPSPPDKFPRIPRLRDKFWGPELKRGLKIELGKQELRKTEKCSDSGLAWTLQRMAFPAESLDLVRRLA